jgi:hypothetical protein
VEVTITAVGEDPPDLRSLREWLVQEDELRGRVKLVEPAPQSGSLGATLDALLVVLGPGGAATILAGALISWIRHRRPPEARYEITLPDGTSVKLSTRQVRGMDADAVRKLVADVSQAVTLVAESGASTKGLDKGSGAGADR